MLTYIKNRKPIFFSKLKILSIILTIYSGLSGSSIFAETLKLTADESYTIGRAVEFYQDRTGKMNIIQIQQLSQNRWQRGQRDRLAFGINDDVVWLRGSLLNLSDQRQWNLLCEQRLEHINLYIFLNNNLVQHYKSGIADIENKDRLPAISLNLEKNKKYNFYLSIRSTTSKRLSFYINSPQRQLDRLMILNGIHVVFFTFVLIMILINIVLAFRLKSNVQLYYISWVLLTGLFQFVVAGYCFKYITQSLWWNARLGLAISSCGAIILILFWDKMLILPIHAPYWRRFILLFVPVYALLIFASLNPGIDRLIVNICVHIISIILLAAMLASSVVTMLRGFRTALYSTIGTGLFFSFLIIYVMGGLGLLPSSYLTDYAVLFGYMSETIFFLISLSVRTATLQAMGSKLSERKQIEIYRRQYSIRRNSERRNLTTVDINQLGVDLHRLMNKERLYCDEDLSLDRLASLAQVSRHQLSEYLNSHLGKNYHSYINELRIQDACQLLRNEPGLSVLNIALATGYNSKSVFNSEFKKQTGQTPSQYRRNSSI